MMEKNKTIVELAHDYALDSAGIVWKSGNASKILQ